MSLAGFPSPDYPACFARNLRMDGSSNPADLLPRMLMIPYSRSLSILLDSFYTLRHSRADT